MGGKLTTAEVEGAAAGLHFDGDGLYLQVTGPKSKSWIYRYSLHGKPRWMGLGSAKYVSLSKARQKRDKARAQVRSDGIDLVAEQKRQRAASRAEERNVTFRQAAESYIAAQEGAWSNRKHTRQWSSTLNTYVFPVIGGAPVQEISRAHVISALEPIWTAKPETARRVRGRIEAVIDWAIARGDRTVEDNPARGGALLKGLAKQSKAVKPHAALPYREIGAFMVKLRSRGGTAARALEFAILTAARTSEVLGAKWSEIDANYTVWTIPAARMKAGREHRVPLANAAADVLHAMAQMRDGDLIFPGANGRPLSNMAMLAVLRRMGRADLTAHGFRSTFRDWGAELTAFPNELLEMALAHKVPDKTEAAYRRGDLLDKRRRLMDAWAEYCGKLAPAGEVIPISARGARGAS
jgi:integrase